MANGLPNAGLNVVVPRSHVLPDDGYRRRGLQDRDLAREVFHRAVFAHARHDAVSRLKRIRERYPGFRQCGSDVRQDVHVRRPFVMEVSMSICHVRSHERVPGAVRIDRFQDFPDEQPALHLSSPRRPSPTDTRT